MGSKRTSRRDILKGSAALAGGLAVAAQTSAAGQTPSSASAPAPEHDHAMDMAAPDTPMIKGTKDLNTVRPEIAQCNIRAISSDQ